MNRSVVTVLSSLAIVVIVFAIIWILGLTTLSSYTGAIGGMVGGMLGTMYLRRFQDERFRQIMNLAARNVFVYLMVLLPLSSVVLLQADTFTAQMVAGLILIPWMGGVGAAIVTTSVTCLVAAGSFLAVYRLWGVLPPGKTFLKSVFCSGLALAMAIFWPVSGLMVILKLLAIVTVIFIAFLLLGDFTPGEVALIRTLIRRRKWSDEDEIDAQ